MKRMASIDGQACYAVGSDTVQAFLTVQGGHMTAEFKGKGKPLAPFYTTSGVMLGLSGLRVRSSANSSRTSVGASATSAAMTSEMTSLSRTARKSASSAIDQWANSGSKHPPKTDVSM